jgi:hypothetical protein
MGRAGRARAEEFSWPQVTARVESYYNFVIRRLAATGQLPEGFSAPIPARPTTQLQIPVIASRRVETDVTDSVSGASPPGAED